MAVLIENLIDSLKQALRQYEELVVISGYSSPDVIESIAKEGKPVVFYYGMYGAEGITERQLNNFKDLQQRYSNLSIRLVHTHRVHTKCYLFLQEHQIQHALVGSANFSSNGLLGVKNSEILVELNASELVPNSNYLDRLNEYWNDVQSISVGCTDPMVIARPKVKPRRSIFKKSGKAVFPLTGNPYSAIMPFYSIKDGKKVINKGSGINWGLQRGHTKKTSEYKEAYIPVYVELIENYPLLFPPFPEIRTTSEGKENRKADPVTVLWDDGEVMQMIFSGGGVERPTEGKRNPGDPFREYPKQFTSADGGGEALGKYLRTRMGVDAKSLITLADFKRYGRDYITLTYIAPGYYEADFSNT